MGGHRPWPDGHTVTSPNTRGRFPAILRLSKLKGELGKTYCHTLGRRGGRWRTGLQRPPESAGFAPEHKGSLVSRTEPTARRPCRAPDT